MTNPARELHTWINANRLLLPELRGNHPGRVYILGSGPSVEDASGDLLAPDDAAIYLNSAIKMASNRKARQCYWLTVENSTFQWPWWHEAQDFTGQVIMERALPDLMAQMDVDPYATYPREWWERAIYVSRYPREGNDPDIRQSANGHGLSYGTVRYVQNGEGCTKNAGGVLFSALHLAGIMGAARVVLYGCEQGWREGQPQHFDGLNCYTQEYAESNGGQTDLMEIQGWHTQRLYVEAAVAIQRFMVECGEQGMRVENRSGGLLDLDLTGVL